MVDLFRNPTSPVDNWGASLDPYISDDNPMRLKERPAHMVLVDSRNRNRTQFPNANQFRVQLQHPVRGVYSVELLSAIIPIPQDGAGVSLVTERYVTIRSSELQILEPAQGTNDETGDFYVANADGGFAEIPLIPNYPLAYTGGNAASADTTMATHWKKSECRIIKRFFPFKSELRYLDIELVLRNNAWPTVPATPRTILYPLPNDSTDPLVEPSVESNIVLLFEIVAKT